MTDRILDIVYLARGRVRRPIRVVVTWWTVFAASVVLLVASRLGSQSAGAVASPILLVLFLYLLTPVSRR